MQVSWEKRYESLKRFHRRHGHTAVPTTDKQLSSWVHEQRRMRRDGKMSQERYMLLDNLGFDWNKCPRVNRQWCQWYRALEQFKKRNGHVRVPRREQKLLHWIYRQRSALRKGEIDPEHFSLLNELGFEWNSPFVSSASDVKWFQHYLALRKFHEQHGHTRTRMTDDVRLRRWVNHQRHIKRTKGMNQMRIALLNNLQFPWKPDFADSYKANNNNIGGKWHNRYLALEAFWKQHGHTRVTLGKHDKGLSNWVTTQRRRKRAGQMQQERIELLNKLQFQWSPNTSPIGNQSLYLDNGDGINDSKSSHYTVMSETEISQNREWDEEVVIRNCSERTWEKQFKKVENLGQKYGQLHVLEETNDKGLASWCQLQRDVYGCGEMEPEHFRRLVGIQFQLVDLKAEDNEDSNIGPVACLDFVRHFP